MENSKSKAEVFSFQTFEEEAIRQLKEGKPP